MTSSKIKIFTFFCMEIVFNSRGSKSSLNAITFADDLFDLIKSLMEIFSCHLLHMLINGIIPIKIVV